MSRGFVGTMFYQMGSKIVIANHCLQYDNKHIERLSKRLSDGLLSMEHTALNMSFRAIRRDSPSM